MTLVKICELRGPIVAVAACVAMLIAGAPAGGQIYEWRDDTNVRHFANSLEQVPQDARAGATVVADAAPKSKDEATTQSVSPPDDKGPTDQVREENRLHQEALQSEWDTGFNAGWEAGYAAAVAAQQSAWLSQLQASLSQSGPPVVINVPRYDPSGLYYHPPFDGLSGPFDDGSSLGMTYREQLQNQRAIERGW